MCGFMPSHTMRPRSSWLNPSRSDNRRTVPDCELPRATAWVMCPAIGFVAPDASCFSYLKNDAMSRVAAETDAEHQRIFGGVLQFV